MLYTFVLQHIVELVNECCLNDLWILHSCRSSSGRLLLALIWSLWSFAPRVAVGWAHGRGRGRRDVHCIIRDGAGARGRAGADRSRTRGSVFSLKRVHVESGSLRGGYGRHVRSLLACLSVEPQCMDRLLTALTQKSRSICMSCFVLLGLEIGFKK